MKIVLFALTGMGNEVLRSLLALGSRSDLLVITRRETNPFPYYPCEPLENLCNKYDIEVCTDCNFHSGSCSQVIRRFKPDLGIAATFHRIVPKSVREIFRIGCFNIHSSLLPDFRGPTPTAWTILFDKPFSGLTFHEMTDEVDMGTIHYQVKVPVSNMCDGELRHALSRCAGTEITNFLSAITTCPVCVPPQGNSSGSSNPHILSDAGIRIIATHSFAKSLIQRATTPYPGYEQFLEKLHVQKANFK